MRLILILAVIQVLFQVSNQLPWEAALGAKVVVPTLNGKIQLSVPSNSQSGQKLRVKRKGLPKRNQRGDLLVVLKVVMPDDPDGDLHPHWEKLAKAVSFSPRSEWESR